MSALDLITLADYKAWAPLQGNTKDRQLVEFIAEASRMIETDVGRRLVYRAPPEVAGGANIVAEVALAVGNLTIANQPNAAGRFLIYTVTGDEDFSISGGTITATGTFDGVAGATEVIDLANGLVQHGTKLCTALTTIAVANLGGAGGNDKVKVGSSLGYVEYHTPGGDPTVIRPLEWPVLSIAEVNEDASRAYGTSTKLVRDVGYLVTRCSDGDALVRLSSSLPIAWTYGWRAEKLALSAGYTAATVPAQIKGVCRRLVKLLYTENEKGQIEVSSWSNALGSGARFGSARVTREMRRALDPFRRNRFGMDTGARDFDLEAA